MKLRGYESMIHELDPNINPVGVENSMRLQFGTLNHLPKSEFLREIQIAKDCQRQDPGYLRGVAASYGDAERFDEWEEAHKNGTVEPMDLKLNY